MSWKGLAVVLAASAAGQMRPSSRRQSRLPGRSTPRWQRWLGEPRNAVLFVLGAVLLAGGGRKLLQGWRAREAIGRLEDPDVTPEVVHAAAEHGRAGLIELFRLLGTSEKVAVREAAGHALSILWARDDLIAEEEKALVRRGFQVQWRARRRYPRALRAEIPISIAFGVPFLREDGEGVGPDRLEWSYRIRGARRASLEVQGPWVAGPGRASFTMIPTDFETNGPHRLVLEARVRTQGLTEAWELDLPHVPFTFEFDPLLAVDALFALPDNARGEAIACGLRLSQAQPSLTTGGPDFLPLNDRFAVRDAPSLEVDTPLPCDLAHAIDLEFEGLTGKFPAGTLVLSGQGDVPSTVRSTVRFPVGPVTPLPADAIERPGTYRMRVCLVADPDRGWSDPDVRSVWPGALETPWVEVEVVRR